jgi:hypothetical protein
MAYKLTVDDQEGNRAVFEYENHPEALVMAEAWRDAQFTVEGPTETDGGV